MFLSPPRTLRGFPRQLYGTTLRGSEQRTQVRGHGRLPPAGILTLLLPAGEADDGSVAPPTLLGDPFLLRRTFPSAAVAAETSSPLHQLRSAALPGRVLRSVRATPEPCSRSGVRRKPGRHA